MKATRIFETVLYSTDIPATQRFYSDVLGLDLLSASDTFLAFRLPAGVLLIFDPAHAERTDRGVPAHGARGRGHIAFAARPDELDGWRAHLAANDVPIEMEVNWDAGGTSLYFRDPTGNSVELAPHTLWGGGWDF